MMRVWNTYHLLRWITPQVTCYSIKENNLKTLIMVETTFSVERFNYPVLTIRVLLSLPFYRERVWNLSFSSGDRLATCRWSTCPKHLTPYVGFRILGRNPEQACNWWWGSCYFLNAIPFWSKGVFGFDNPAFHSSHFELGSSDTKQLLLKEESLSS